MHDLTTFIRRYLNSVAPIALTALAVGIPGVASARDDARALLVTGIQTDYGDMVNRNAGGGVMGGFTADDLCLNSDRIGWAMSEIVNQVESSMREAGSPIQLSDIERMPGAPTRPEIEDGLRTARDEFCDTSEPPPSVRPFVLTYAHCRMAMITPEHAMDIHLPPQVGTGTMSMADFTRREVVQLSLTRNLDSVSSIVGSGWSGDVSMTNPAADGERIGYPTTRYAFEYAGGPGDTGLAGMFGASIEVKNEGTVWVSDDVPGIGIMKTFYENLTTEVARGDGSFGFFDGMLKNLVGLLQHGMPLELDQTVSSSVNGRTSVSGRSHQVVTNVQVVDFEPGWCEQSLMPPNYAVIDVDQQINEALAESGMTSEDLSAAMQEYQQAMEQLTPEQRQMMEQMGMGDMMQQMGGGAAGAAPAAGAAASAALVTGDPVQSTQNLLQALGYDVGSDGASLQTQISIAEFQADAGMDVTGEVSDELVRALSDAVDRRGGR